MLARLTAPSPARAPPAARAPAAPRSAAPRRAAQPPRRPALPAPRATAAKVDVGGWRRGEGGGRRGCVGAAWPTASAVGAAPRARLGPGGPGRAPMAAGASNARPWAGARRPKARPLPRRARPRVRGRARPPPTLILSPPSPQVDYGALAADLDLKSPLEIMDHVRGGGGEGRRVAVGPRAAPTRTLCFQALATFGDTVAIAFSGAEDVALIEYAHLTGRPYRVFSLDTGRLNPETYRLFDAVEKHYKIRIEYTFPDAQETMDFVREKGLFSFYEDGHGECCRVRKVRPLRRQLATLAAWITGQRKDQSPGTRAEVPVVQVDPVFEGAAGGPGSLIKFNPLSNASSPEVWHFLRVMGVPINALHACGYDSIGCEPCTRAVLPNQHEREGRWWWEDAADKECGLHSGNVASAAAQAAAEAAAPDLWATAAVARPDQGSLASLVASTNRPKATFIALYAPWCQFCQALEPALAALADTHAGGPTADVAVFRADGEAERAFAEIELGLTTFPTLVLLPKGGGKPVKYASEARDVASLDMFVRALAGFETGA